MTVLSKLRTNKKAVLVGIKYTSNANLKAHDFGEQEGAHRDVDSLQNVLITKYGYQKEDITVLQDVAGTEYESSWPSRENIIREMKTLVANAHAGDHIVFAFSGHGSQVKVLEDVNEVDGYDEVLLPIDSSVDPNSSDNYVDFIRDDEINDIFVDELREGVRCVLIFDCCHSGTASDLPNVDINPWSPISPLGGATSRGFAKMPTVHAHEGPSYAWPSRRDSYTLSGQNNYVFEKDVTSWSACLDEQITYGRKRGGVFIQALVKALESESSPTQRQLLDILRKELIEVTAHANKGLVKRGANAQYTAPRPQLGSLRPKGATLCAPFSF